MAKRTQLESVMPAYFFMGHAVSGHAEKPEKGRTNRLSAAAAPRYQKP